MALGGIIHNHADNREIVPIKEQKKIDDQQTWKLVLGWILAFIVILYFAQQLKQPKSMVNTTQSTPTQEKGTK